jgi:hypothetical protein
MRRIITVSMVVFITIVAVKPEPVIDWRMAPDANDYLLPPQEVKP